MKPIKTRDEFEDKLAEAIDQTRDALDRANAGEEMPGAPIQYEKLLEYLEKVQSDVKNDTIPPRNDRHSQSVGWILVDGWDPADPLGELILHVDGYYLTKL